MENREQRMRVVVMAGEQSYMQEQKVESVVVVLLFAIEVG